MKCQNFYPCIISGDGSQKYRNIKSSLVHMSTIFDPIVNKYIRRYIWFLTNLVYIEKHNTGYLYYVILSATPSRGQHSNTIAPSS